MNRREFIQTGGLAAVVATVGHRLSAAETSEPRPLRIAQIGTAHSHAVGKWTTLTKFPRIFAPAGIWEPDAALRRQAQAQPAYAGVRWLEEAELWADRDLQAVVVETEVDQVLGLGRRVVESGRHLHIEKPPGANLASLVALQAAAAAGRRVVQTGYMFRFHPAFRFCFETVSAGWLGRIFAAHGDIGSDLPVERRPELAKLYGGSMLLLGSHLIDAAMTVMGSPVKVSATRHRSFPERDDYYDNEVAVLDYLHGSAVIRCLTSEPNAGPRRQFLVFGENGTLEILPLEPAKVRLTLKRPAGSYAAGTHAIKLEPPTGRYDDMLIDFARQCRGEPSILPQFNPAHELAVQRVTLECYA